MKVLIVCSGNAKGGNFDFRINQSFIYEQIEAIKKIFSIDYGVFLIKGTGVKGYLENLPALRQEAKKGGYQLIHAHYGSSGLLAGLQRRVPVLVTYHGSDIDLPQERRLSRLAMRLAAHNIFVTRRLAEKAGARKGFDVVSCGVDFERMHPLDKLECRKKLGLDPSGKYALFGGAFDNPVKNYPAAREAVARTGGKIQLLELKGYTREEVNLLMNACDLVLVTSRHESGPLVVKEAIACGCPVVATDVGDVREVIGGLAGCYITSYAVEEIAAKISLAAEFGKTQGRRQIVYLDNKLLAEKVFGIYQKVLNNCGNHMA